MGRSTRDWNKGLANDFKDTTFMRAFISASLDEGVPIQQVLRKLDVVGLTETSKKGSLPSGN